MRAIIFSLITLSLFGCTKAQIIKKTFSPDQIIHISDFKARKNVEDINNTVAYIEKGDVIPLKLTVESHYFALKQSKVELIVQQRLYFRVLLSEEMTPEKIAELKAMDSDSMAQMSPSEMKKLLKNIMLHVSRDAERWAPINDARALKEVLGIDGGSISFGAGVNEDEGLWTSLIIKIIQKS